MPFSFTLRIRSWIEVKSGELPQLLCCVSIKTNLEITVLPSVRECPSIWPCTRLYEMFCCLLYTRNIAVRLGWLGTHLYYLYRGGRYVLEVPPCPPNPLYPPPPPAGYDGSPSYWTSALNPVASSALYLTIWLRPSGRRTLYSPCTVCPSLLSCCL